MRKNLTEEYDVVVMCERSGRVRDALIAQGIRAISCDIKESRVSGPHYHGDARDIIGLPWVAMIAHPVCRYLTNAGAKHLYVAGRAENGKDEIRWAKMREGAKFFRLFNDARHIPLRATENPIPHKYARELMGGAATQYIQPWWFGSPFQKATGLWLHGFDPLPQEKQKSWYAEKGIAIKQAVWLMGPSEDREEKRSETDAQVARALAQYWAPQIRAAVTAKLIYRSAA